MLAAVLILLGLTAAAAQDAPPGAPPAAAPRQEAGQAGGQGAGTVSEVRFEGSQRVSQELLRLQIRTRPGTVYSRETVDQDLKLLAARFLIWGSSRADRLPDGTWRVVFTLDDVPSIRRVQFRGNSELDEEDLRGALGLSENNVLQGATPGEGGLALLVRKLEEKYQEEGHLYCEIEARVEKQGGDSVLVFDIIEGPSVSIDHIDFVGECDLAPRHLRSVMKSSRSFWFFTQTYKPRELADDVVQIEQLLRDEGYLDARVAVESVTPDEDGEEVDLLIRIEQGPRFLVHSVRFSGNETFSADELMALVKITPGTPYRQAVYRKDRKRILDHYRHLGYVRAEVSPRASESYQPDGATVDVTFSIAEDTPKRVRDVRVIGNTNTKDAVIRRELDLYPGQLFDGTLMDEAEDRLRATGFFADERGQPLAWVENEKTDDPEVEDVVMRVEDGTAGLFSLFGGVASGTGVFVGTDLTIENFDLFDLPSAPGELLSEFLDQKAFHGAGQKLRLRANPGNEFSNYVAQFTEPYLTGPIERPIFLQTDLHIYEYAPRFYDEKTQGGVVTFGKQLSRQMSVSLGYRQDYITIDNIVQRADPIEDLLAVEGGNSVRGIEANVNWKKFDSLRNPTEGKRIGADGSWLGGPFGAEYDVVKLSGYGEILIPIWENEDEQRHVVSTRGAIGWAAPYADTDDVPIFERYYCGGASGFLQMRGFEYRGVGPHDDDFSEGGTAGWVINSEYVFPLMDTYDARIRESSPFLRGVVFLDQGMLEEDWSQLQDGKWRMSVGVGMRMKIPFQLLSAPLEIYYGIPLQRKREDERESFQINFSTRF